MSILENINLIIPLFTLLAGWIGNLFYARLTKKKKENEVSKDEYSSFQQVSQDYMKNLKELIDEVTSLSEKVLGLKVENGEMSVQLSKQNITIDSLKNETKKMIKDINNKDNELAELQEKLKGLECELEWMHSNCECPPNDVNEGNSEKNSKN